MKKYLYAVPLLAFGFGIMLSAHAEVKTGLAYAHVTVEYEHKELRSDYQVFPVHLQWTKENYDSNHAPIVLMPFNLPKSVPNGAEFVGVTGTITATTVGESPEENKDAVALLEMFSSSSDYCPKMGETINPSTFNLYDTSKFTSYFSQIMKQTNVGDKTLDIDYTMAQGLPLNLGEDKCMFLKFDGWDWQSKPYTITADLEIKYKTSASNYNPNIQKKSLDVENLWGAPDTGYTVYPVLKDGNSANQTLPPGTIMSVFGGVGVLNVNYPNLKDWVVQSKIVVYKNGSCETAFPKHRLSRFRWQDTDSTSWDTSIVIAEKTLKGSGINAALTQMTGNGNLPIHVEDGDCVAQAFVNSNVYGITDPLNEEGQAGFSFIPD